MTVYPDEVFFLNTLLDLLLLETASLLSDSPHGRRRRLAAALFGGLYAAFAAVYPFLSQLPIRLAAAAVLCLLAFGAGKTALRQSALFVLACCGYGGLVLLAAVLCKSRVRLLGGTAYYLLSLRFLLLLAGLLYAGVWLTVRRLCRHLGGLVRVRFTLQGRQAEATALCDTGNTLKDPVSAEPVIIADLKTAQTLLPQVGISRTDLRQPTELLQKIILLCPSAKPRLLPFSTVADGGLLLAIRCSMIEVNGKKTDQHILAFSASEFTESYQALTGGIYGSEQTKNRPLAIGDPKERIRALYRRQRHPAPAAVGCGGTGTVAKDGTGR